MEIKLKSINKNKLQHVMKCFLTIAIIILELMLLSTEGFATFNLRKICGTVLVVLSVIFIWINNPFNDKWNKIITRSLFFVSPIVSFALIEIFNYAWFYKMRVLSITLNLLIYFIILMLFFVVTNKIKASALLLIWTSFLFGIISYSVSVFRGSSLVVSDFTAMATAVSVADEYHLVLRDIDYCIIIANLLFSIVVLKMRDYKGFSWKIRIVNVLVLGLMLGYFINIFYLTDQIRDWKFGISIWNPKKSYRKIGTALTVAFSGRFLIVEEPDGYSVKRVKEITQPYIDKQKAEIESTVEQPNIIAVMNEAFSDFSDIGAFEVSEDYLPFYRSLKENTVKGTAYVSVLGGRTANSEFEFLTGNTLAFFPKSSVPMQLYAKKKLPGITYTLKDQGYEGISALHPYRGSGWGRNKAYPFLGFDKFITMDDFENPELVRKYISDQEDFDKVIEEYEEVRKNSSEPFYLFNVTMQNHGAYDTDYDSLPKVIQVTDEEMNQEKYQVNEVENYLNLIKKTDTAFENLISYFENIDEPTIIVMFGDHQPNISSFQKRISLRDGKGERLYNYQVPFVIWANYDIQEQNVEKISLNYLSSLVTDIAGVETTAYQEYLLDLQKEISAITVFGYYGANGKFYKLDNKESPYYEMIKEYQYLQYNEVFDVENRINQFFFLDKK